jgi:hypothetical protein
MGRIYNKFKKIGVWLAGGLVVALATMAIILPATVVRADDETPQHAVMQISPLKERQDLKPGQKYEGSFEIYNRGNEPLDFRVYVKPFTIGPDCTDNYEITSDYTQMTSWVTFDQLNYYDIQPDKSQTIKFTVDVPKNAPSGGQYVVIFAETGDFNTQDGTAISVKERLGYKFYANLGGTDKEAGQVESVEQGSWFWEPPISGLSKVRNTGNVDFTETHTYTITGLNGKEVYQKEQKEDVLPDTCRQIKQQWDKTPAFGIYWVENKVDFLGQERFNERKLVIVIPIYIVIIFSLVIILLIWALVLKIRGGKTKPAPKKES